MAQTLPQGVVVPNADGGEQISATGVQEMRTLGASVDTALASKANTSYVDAEVESARWGRGRFNEEASVTALAPGVYTIGTMTAVERLSGLPEAVQGTLVVEGEAGELVRSFTYSPYSRDYTYTMRTATGGATTPWVKHGATLNKGRLTTEVDAFTLDPGFYTVSSLAAAERVANLPEDWPGTLIVEGNPGEGVKAIRFLPYSRDYSYETVAQNLSGDFMPWRRIAGGGSVGSGVSPFTQHSVRLTELMYAYDGPVSTGGLGAVAWRIDHGFRNFRDKMLPIFRAAGIVPMITYNPRNWGLAQNDGVTPAEVNQWVADGWVEISNHGAHHNNASGEEDIYDFVVKGLEEIEAELPAAQGKVFGFCIPGVGGGDAYDGFQSGATPEQWDTYAGRLILQHHAVGYGYMPGTDLRILDGTPRNGMSHLTTDTRPVATVKARIDEAIEQRRGLQIMSHPSNLDADGYHSTAMIQQIVDYIVEKRSAGELVTLSPYQMMVADATIPPGVDVDAALAAYRAAIA